MNYLLPDFVVNGTTDPRRENDPGIICIGGDLCDVFASSAYQEEDGKVRLVDCTINTSLEALEEMKGQELRDELENMANDVVAASYASISTDTFTRQKRAKWPIGDTVVVPA